MNKGNINKLYCIIGVLTLIVVAIGATFAYFSASAKNDETIVGSTNDVATLNLDVKLVSRNTSSDLIPLNIIPNQKLKDDSGSEYVDPVDQFDLAILNECVDSNNSNICAVYKIVIGNTSSSNTINVQGKVVLESTAQNMKWMLINGDVKKMVDEIDSSETELLDNTKTSRISDFNIVNVNNVGYLTYKSSISEEGKYINEASNVTLSSTTKEDGVSNFSSKTFYILVWLEETGDVQEDVDSGQYYYGTVTFDAVSSSGNSTGISASFVH